MEGRDVKPVADLEKACFSEAWSENLISSGLGSRLDTYFVYEASGEVKGYAVLRILGDEDLEEINLQIKSSSKKFRRLL